MSHVDIKDLDIRLSGVDIISKLNLAVEQGEFLVLLGPSGCGKSTLLHSIAGLIDVHDGSLEIGGNDVTWADPKDRGIGMVFQSYALYPTMTVEKNMSFGARISGVGRDEVARRVERAATMLHLTELLKRKPAQLSGGQRQRVAIGRALVRNAGVFLFDEPLSNLDAKLRGELRRELKQLHKNLGTTMIYVTHDQVEAMTLASRIAVMQGGRIQQIDTPAAVYGHPVNMFVAGFLGAPSMNFFEGRLEQRDSRWHFVADALQADLAAYPFAMPPQHGQKAVLGVRPEDVHLAIRPDDAHLAGAPAPAGRPDSVPAGRAVVSLVEPMGSSQIVWLDAHGVSLAVETDSAFAPPAEHAALDFRLAADKLSLFDAATQLRL
jgi:multiple sugar transport system ATP-binding protein